MQFSVKSLVILKHVRMKFGFIQSGNTVGGGGGVGWGWGGTKESLGQPAISSPIPQHGDELTCKHW